MLEGSVSIWDGEKWVEPDPAFWENWNRENPPPYWAAIYEAQARQAEGQATHPDTLWHDDDIPYSYRTWILGELPF